MWMGYIRRWNK